MTFAFNIYAILLLVSGLAILCMSSLIIRRENGTMKWLGCTLFSNAVWSIAYGFELASPTAWQMKFFTNIEYLGIATLPVFWYLFCLSMCSKDEWYGRTRNMALLFVVPCVTILLVWTNSLHHWYYRSHSANFMGPFPMADIEPGWFYRFFTVYFYGLLAHGVYLLIINFRRTDPIYRAQHHLILFASFIPWIANILYVLGIRPLVNLDLTPFAFTLTIIIVLIAIYRFKIFDVIPLAREKVLDLMQDGFILLDERDRMIDINSAAKRFLGLGDRLIGRSIYSFISEESELTAAIRQKKPGKIEVRTAATTGKLQLEAELRFMDDSKFNVPVTLVKIQDLTTLRQDALRLKEQAHELQQLNQLKDTIFSVIAHDLRGPLVNLSEVIKMLSKDQITLEEFKEIAPGVNRDILYTTDLLENILHWSRSQMKGFELQRDHFSLNALVEHEAGYYEPAAKAKSISITKDLGADLIIHADKLMIQIVVRNLVNNAIKFCLPGGNIHLATKISGGIAQLSIADTGIGIAPERIPSMFSFSNRSTRGTHNERGTGLGLLVCKDFMIRNGGSITVKSAPGQGTTFCINLPLPAA
ncbi:PAS domain-containing sensor histidine kinase [Pedobacter yulinensis]|uniref:histidine kinase n=1 Tax=Pedobacter yulinensis TaxID=2126353 RepID=A0A2T3HIF8_9SPHI|nr:histidine kinase N-terminal 7TM domain-containing protein [Pedobacter yulinensis]PST82193.1 PAS domain-containing sensor histidine kinase [Pedobacter yulinensis]